MSDPDDHLRLVQVRDWLAGQSWFDVSQHRFDPPRGGDMHWSRIVDLPIAALILLLGPLLGPTAAEAVAIALVPLLLLGGTMIALGCAARPLAGRGGALLAVLLVPLIPSLLIQMAPTRIDHHGWQIAMAALCLAILVASRGSRAAAAAGFAAAVWVHVSAEALPYLAAIGAVLGLRYLLDEQERPRLVAYLAALAGGSLALFAATRPIAEWFVPKCDALSIPFLVPFFLAALIAAGGTYVARGRHVAVRGAVLALAGGAAAAAFIGIGGNCLAGPFATLPPIVYHFWYLNVAEGLPVWMQPAATIVGSVWTPIVGGVGTWLGWRSSADAEQAKGWATVALLLAAATALALLVQRAEAVAHLYALPGAAVLLLTLLRRVSRLKQPLVRVPLTSLAIILPSPAPAMLGASQFGRDEAAIFEAGTSEGIGCATAESFAGLSELPPQTLFAPIAIGPALLTATPHKAVAGGYHRNAEAMRDVFDSFLGSPEKARATMAAKGARLIVYCSELSEVQRYVSAAPQGFMAKLERGEVPAWLEPVRIPRSEALRVYRLRDEKRGRSF